MAQRSPTRPPASGSGFPALVGVARFDSWPGSGGRLPLEQELETMEHNIACEACDWHGQEDETGCRSEHDEFICPACGALIDAERKEVGA